MIHNSHFQKNDDPNVDARLVNETLQGNRKSLETLIARNQSYIFNVALKMFNSVEDAEDVSQEVLIKIITKLSEYDSHKSQFRTWAYRITVNHFLDWRKSSYEKRVSNFTDFFGAIESVSDADVNDEDDKNRNLLIEESKVACMAGMLMCLNREQRLIYIIGEIFRIDHKVASEIFGMTPDNFRQKLSRTRKDLYQWMNNRCGLVNRNNPCRCHKKTKGFIAKGWINPDNMKWHSDYKQKIYEWSNDKVGELDVAWDDVYASLYREHPFKIHNTAMQLVNKILGNQSIRDNLNLN